MFEIMIQNKKSFTVDELQKKMEYYCVYQDRCHQEVERKMTEYQLIPEAKEKILLHLMQHNFLNEERFSKSFARGKFRIKNWGKQRIVRELKIKNISSYNIKTALKEIDDELYIKTIEKIAASKNNTIKESNLFKKKKKIYDYLYRKGYESSLIQETISKL
ncbi:MAG: RecX family transcriptional regulator [Flavobacteriaceae bacterium]|nr:RecX family transcriptional regulator [Flavobacteriaceae bacterium]